MITQGEEETTSSGGNRTQSHIASYPKPLLLSLRGQKLGVEWWASRTQRRVQLGAESLSGGLLQIDV